MGVEKSAYLAAFLVVAALCASAYAAGSGAAAGGSADPAKQTGYYLEARVQHLSCTIDFSTTVMNDVVSAVPGGVSALSADISKLGADKSQLSSLASAGDPNAFDSFVQGTLVPDAKQGVSDLHTARQGFKDENITNDTRAQLKGEYDSARSALDTCNNGAVGTLLQARISQFNAAIGDWGTRISNFGQKGFDTAAMQAVATGATGSVIAPLQSALQSADLAQMKAALQTYCLGDGCNGDKNASGQPFDYHGYARMSLETLQAVVDKAGSDPRLANLTAAGMMVDSSKLDDAKQQLGNVRSTLSSVGTAKYTPEQSQSISSGLKAASQDIKDYLQGIRDSMQQFRQKMMAARGNRTGNYTGGRGGMGNGNFGNRSGMVGNGTGGRGIGGRNFGNRTGGMGIGPNGNGNAGGQNQ